MKVSKVGDTLVMSTAIAKEIVELLESGTPEKRKKAATYLRIHVGGGKGEE